MHWDDSVPKCRQSKTSQSLNRIKTSLVHFKLFLPEKLPFVALVNEHLRVGLLWQLALIIPTNTICCHLNSITFYVVFNTVFLSHFPLCSVDILWPIPIFSILLIHPSLLILSATIKTSNWNALNQLHSLFLHPTTWILLSL